MRFGMGILLTPEENEMTYPIVRPCYAVLGLANALLLFRRRMGRIPTRANK